MKFALLLLLAFNVQAQDYPTRPVRMVMPFDDASDDLPFIKQTKNGPMVIMPPEILWQGFNDTFDQLYKEGKAGSPKWTELTLHCHMAGRPTLIPTVRKCIEYARQHEGVWFPRKRDIAEWALKNR